MAAASVEAAVSSAVGEVKDALLGSTSDPQLSLQTKEAFLKHARKDDESGEWYLGEDDFVDAITPEGENFVGRTGRSSMDPGNAC